MSVAKTLSLLLIATAVACGAPREKADEAPAPAPASAPEVEAESVPAPAPVVAEEKPALGTTVPPFDSAAVGDAAAERSRALNIQGLALHREKKHVEAATIFIQALQANPGNPLARYNLACTYNLGGMRAQALATLEQLKRDDCRACVAQILGAPTDKDWQSALDDQGFKAVLSGLDLKSPSKKDLAKTVRKAFEKGEPDLIAEFVHPARATAFRYSYGLCNPDEEDCEGVEKVYGLDAFSKAMKALVSTKHSETSDLSFTVSHGMGSCDGKCCDYTMKSLTHGVLWLSKVCFLDKAGVLFISEIEVTDES